MQPNIREIFNDRIYGKRFVELFTDMAVTLTNDRIEELYNDMGTRQVPMSFEEVSSKAAAFNNELINRSVWIREDYKENKGYSSPRVTRGCKKVIEQCMKDYIRALELSNTTNRFHSYA